MDPRCAHCNNKMPWERRVLANVRVRIAHPINRTPALVERLEGFCDQQCLAAFRATQEANHA